MSGRKTVLIVDDDPGTLYVLANGLSNVLALFDVITAGNGREAIDALEERQIDVLVTDLSMPVMDGFALIAYVTNQRSALPVVVLSGMAPHSMDQRLAGYGGLRVLRKPAGYQDVAQCVLEEIERVDMGQVEGIPLASVLQLLEAERRSCSVVVTSGKRRGRLQFESGRLVNAFSDDFGAEGEAAAYDILSWNDTAIEFEHLPDILRKLIHTPMQLMLIELAVVQDQIRGHQDGSPADDAILEGGASDGTDDDLLAGTSADAPQLALAGTSTDAPQLATDAIETATDDTGGGATHVATDDAGDDATLVPAGAAIGAPADEQADDTAVARDVAPTEAPIAAPAEASTAASSAAHPGAAADGGGAAPPSPDRPTVGIGFASFAAPQHGAHGEADAGPRPPPHVHIFTAPDPTPSHRDAHAEPDHVAPAAVAEATMHAMTGNGDEMRPDPTNDELMPTDPATTPRAGTIVTTTALATAAPNGEEADAMPQTPTRAFDPSPAAPNAAHGADGDHAAAMVAAVERLAHRARAADEALAAVATEVEAFREAQRSFDDVNARREQRRRELEAFREDVARLAREILGRVDGVFDAMADHDVAPDGAERSDP